jgi:hypothetical protein
LDYFVAVISSAESATGAVRVAKVWNKLPDQVINAPSTNAFKNRLDKYWKSEELYYSDHRAEISGGNRSDIQLPDIDIIGESGEVKPRGASSENLFGIFKLSL